MWEEILKAIPVYFSTMLKFIFGPIGGFAAGLTLITTILVTVGGMMTVVLLFAFFGDFIRDKILNRFFPKRKKFSERNRKFIGIWRKYGLFGVAALTPIFLTPIGGTLLAISVGTPRNKLILYMFISASIWSVILSIIVYFFGNEFLPDYMK
jgi:membrane protein DedA with SNARE-associated domain